ncbi:MAG: site-specific DNA-methyltransferase [Alcanivoracaceae bacterium]|nr:site-specific DNA-methyltransferase [Alcanivoracaceae bacterium]
MSPERRRLPDIKPQTPIAKLDREKYLSLEYEFPVEAVSRVVGMSSSFIRKVCGKKGRLSVVDVLLLLDQDAFSETFVPRSRVIDYLLSKKNLDLETTVNNTPKFLQAYDEKISLLHGNALDIVANLPHKSIQCVVTSTPYWGLRIYKNSHFVRWADGEECPYGHEQTPDGFVRHTSQILEALFEVVADDGSIWWNVMDTFNTRTQIRDNAAEALRAMQGKDGRKWSEHECRRYSAGHAYLKDGEQCLIPGLIAERASRMGFYVKSVITWAKTSSLPEPQNSRVSRNLEYILHLSKSRAPKFDKSAYRSLPASAGGRSGPGEPDKLSDVWMLPTSSGRDGHGAQFPVALPARCIAVSTGPGDTVLDPFVGSGNAGVAAKLLGCRFIGIDINKDYLSLANRRIGKVLEPVQSRT